MSKWFALYSQTGDEIQKIKKLLGGRVPDCVLSTNPQHVDLETRRSPKELHLLVEEQLRRNLQEGDIVTLHGYLHILSSDILAIPGVKFYNGHPGLITMYPELKGKDPQLKVWEGFYPIVGVVIHEVTDELDSGTVLMTSQIATNKEFYKRPFESVLSDIKYLSVGLWNVFLRGVL